VRAALRRLSRGGGNGGTLRHERLALDPASRRVTVGATAVATTRTEYAILETLLRADGAVRSRTELLQAIYGDDAYRDPRGVDVHVHHLREKLEQAGGDPAWVATVRGVGYRLGP
jgi:DNA-binding response OmpR family regulator